MSVKKAVIILLIIAVIGLAVVAVATRGGSVPIYTTTAAVRGPIVQTVSETGTVKSAREIDLNFMNTGRLAQIYHRIGETVKTDDVLAELDYSDIQLKQDEARANVDVARENLNKLKAGATSENRAVSKANVDQAQVAYNAASIELEKTQAASDESIAQAQKTLDDLQSDSPSNVTAAEQAVVSAQTGLDNAKATYQSATDNKKAAGLVAAGDKIAAAKTALDAVNRTITDEDAKDQISRQNPDYLASTQSAYAEARSLSAIADASLTAARAANTNDSVLQALDDASALLNKVFSDLGYCYSALEASITSNSFTQTDLDNFKANISTQQITIGSAISTIQTAEQGLSTAVLSYNTNISTAQTALTTAQTAYNDALNTAKNALSTARVTGERNIASAQYKLNTAEEAWRVAQAQYGQLTAPANEHDIALAEAQLRQAEAALSSFDKQIANSQIKAPIDGIVTKVNFEVGEQISPASGPVVSLLGSSDFEIEVLISEADIAKVAVDNPAMVTLDSFGDDNEFPGQVFFIEPAETKVQDVIYYKVDVSFDPGEAPVKSGMTANVTITTAKRDNVLSVPSRSVITKSGDSTKYIQILVDGQLVEKPVTIGLRGDEGLVEVLSGVNENDTIVTSIKNGK